MRLPNAQQARVDPAKITGYLLSARHPDGGEKAKFFFDFGFRPEQWQGLSEALRVHGANHEVVKIYEDRYGIKYVIDGSLETPDGRSPNVRTVWQIDRGTDHPRFITAYPA